MACPNLQDFSGLVIPFDHQHDRLTHALTTRRRLRKRVWLLKAINQSYNFDGTLVSNACPTAYDGTIDNGDIFMNSHQSYIRLETLMLFGQDTGNLDYRSFVGTFRALPSLQHLLISRFDAKQFNDRTMAALPLRLKSLRLQDLPGITERGLVRLVNGGMDFVQALSLINLNITSAPLLARLLSASSFLVRFTLEQSVSPTVPGQDDPNTPLASFVYSCSTLRTLHWDVSPFSQPSLYHLASSIRRGRFPSLRYVRVPCDDGSIQTLCRPRAQIARPSDLEALSCISLRSSLAVARLAAQERLETARLDPLMRVVVTDETGAVLHKYTIKNYLGTVDSPIHYVLDGPMGFVAGSGDDGIIELESTMQLPETANPAKSGPKMELCCGPPQDIHLSGNVFGAMKKEPQSKHEKSHRPRLKTRHVDTHLFF
jgi:hypothetical protein